MYLNVLPRRDMTDPGGIAIGKFRQAAKLIRREAAKWNLDPYHLHSRLTLAVDAILQTEGFE
jgi:hypothetical protein